MIIYENYITGDDGDYDGYSNNWLAQTFTPQIVHMISKVKLKLFRVGSPGTIAVSIKATSDGKPTGGDLCSGEIEGSVITDNSDGEWYEITLGDGYTFAAGVQYAIVVRAISGGVSDKISWRADTSSPTYTGGTVCTSSDSGIDWGTISGADFMFEEWGVGEPSSTTVVWGNLVKSQISSEKIEAAISRLIQSHEDDPDAHVEIGESLYSHKASDIIDHLIRSIVADKFSDKQFLFRTTFESIDGWDFTGDYYNHAWPGISIHAQASPGECSNLLTSSSGLPDFFDVSKDMFFQFTASVDNNVDCKWYGVIGPEEGDWFGESAFGFYYASGQLKAIRHDGADLYTSDIDGIDVSEPHIYRAMLDSNNKNIKYYIDGVLVTTLEWESWTYSENRACDFFIEREGASLRRFRIQEVILARDI